LKIYTLGTDKRTEEEFLSLLSRYKIELIFDVRRFPTSQFEHFKKENLKRTLERNNIEYLYLGAELGGYRKGGYLAYTKTEDFRKGIEIIKGKAKEKRSAILCAERFPFRCHRRFISQRLKEEGIEIEDIID